MAREAQPIPLPVAARSRSDGSPNISPSLHGATCCRAQAQTYMYVFTDKSRDIGRDGDRDGNKDIEMEIDVGIET